MPKSNKQPRRRRAEWVPNHAQKQYRARRAAENEAATKKELEEVASEIGVTLAAKEGRATKADIREALADAANDEQES